jgi:hypothetical protein
MFQQQQQQHKRKTIFHIEERVKEEKEQNELCACKTLFEKVMKRCRKICIKDIRHTLISTKNLSNDSDEHAHRNVIVQTSLNLVLDDKYEFCGVGCAQVVNTYSKEFATSCAVSSSKNKAQEDAFKKVLERLEPLIS